MTVGRVFLMFDDFCAYIRLTNPWGDGDDDKGKTFTAQPCKGCGEYEQHHMDCRFKDKPLNVPPDLSGLDIRQQFAQAGLPVDPMVKTFHGIDAVRSEDPMLADFLEEIKDTI